MKLICVYIGTEKEKMASSELKCTGYYYIQSFFFLLIVWSFTTQQYVDWFFLIIHHHYYCYFCCCLPLMHFHIFVLSELFVQRVLRRNSFSYSCAKYHGKAEMPLKWMRWFHLLKLEHENIHYSIYSTTATDILHFSIYSLA